MIAEVLDGRRVARALRVRALAEFVRFQHAYAVTPRLAIVLVGADPSARAYLDAIQKAAGGVELPVEVATLPAQVEQAALTDTLLQLNERADVHGVLVLQPLPPHLSRVEVA